MAKKDQGKGEVLGNGRFEITNPSSEQVISSIRRSFEQNVKPTWNQWDKDVRIIVHKGVQH
ncbi:MAG: hypothetical protein ABSA18_01000 [Dehalococcoidia bacterium]